MPDSKTPQIFATLGMNYEPAIKSAREFIAELEKVERKLQSLKGAKTGVVTGIQQELKKEVDAVKKSVAEQIRTVKNAEDKKTSLIQAASKIRQQIFEREQKGLEAALGRLTRGEATLGDIAAITRSYNVANQKSRTLMLNAETDLGKTREQIRRYFLDKEAKAMQKHIKELSEKEKVSGQQLLLIRKEYYDKAIQQYNEFIGKQQKLADKEAKTQERKAKQQSTFVTKTVKPDDFSNLQTRITKHFYDQEQRNFASHLATLEKKQSLSARERLSLEAQYYTKAQTQARRFMQQHMRGIDEFTDMLDRRISWFTAGLAFYGSQQVFSQMLDQIGQIEMGMTQIARITEDPLADFGKMRDELFQLGIDYGQSMQTVQDIALRWAQAGYNVRDSLELTRVSLLALNSAELDATQATQSLVGIMAQWGLQASNLELVLDKINKTADDYAVSSQDLVDGLLRSSGAARVLGLSLDETIAILTVMREASGRTGREVGNALNSILSFMQRDIAIKAFDASGIKLWADEARTQFRNVRDIIGEVAAKWPTLNEATREMFVQAADEAGLYSEEMAEAVGIQKEWNDLQQRNLSQAMAGIYRRTYLLALLSNWSRVQEVLNNMTDAAGYSLRENARTMETYQKKVESLKTALQELSWEIGEAGLLRMMKNLADGTRAAVHWFAQLPPVVQDLTISLTGTLSTLMLFQFGLRSLFGVGVGAGIVTLTQRIKEFSSVIRSSGLLAGAGTLLGTSPAGAGIIAAGAGLTAIALAVKNYNVRQEEHAQIVGQVAKEYEKYSNILNKAAKGTSEYIRASEELQNIKQRLADIAPELVESFDDEGNVVKINEQALLDYGKALDEVTNKSISAAEAEKKALRERVTALQQEIAILERQPDTLKELIDARNKLNNIAQSGASTDKKAQQAKEDLANVEKAIIAIIGQEGLERLKAAGFTKQAVDQEIKKINELLEAKRREEIEAKNAEKRKTAAAIAETKKRIATYSKELEALSTVRIGLIDYGEEVVLPGKGSKAYNEKVKQINAERRRLQDLLSEMKAIDQEIASITATAYNAPAYGGLPPGMESKSKGTSTAKSWSEIFGEELDRVIPPDLVRRAINLSASLETLNLRLELLATTEDTLNQKIKDGTATQEDYTRLQGVLTEKVFLLKQQQTALAQANENLAQQLPYLNAKLKEAEQRYEAMRKAGNLAGMREANEAIKKVRDAISSLNQEIHNNTIEFMKAADAIENYASSALDYLEDLIRRSRELTQEQEKARLEEKRDRAIERIEKQRDAYKELSDARIKAIEDEIAALEKENDLIEEQNRLQEAQKALEEARTRLSNIEGERNVRVWTGSAWEWVADPVAVMDAKRDVEKAEQDLADIQREVRTNARRRELEAQLEYEREQQRIKLESFDKQLEDEKNYWEKRLKDLDNYWKQALDSETIKKDAWLAIQQNGIAGALQMWEEYYKKRAEMANMSWDTYTPPSEPGRGSGTSGSGSGSNVYREGDITYVRNNDGSISKINTKTGTATTIKPNETERLKYVPKEVGGTRSYAVGGPILYDQLAKLHANEYVLNASVVRALGGFAGVERLVAAVKVPSVSFSPKTQTTSYQRVLQILGNINLPNVYDVTGFIRNLEQLAGVN